MKRFIGKRALQILRIFVVVLTAGFVTVSFLAFRVQKKISDDVWQQLGLTKQKGEESISRSFMQGYLYFYDARNLRKLAVGDRLPVAQALLAQTKQYINSEAFKKAYEKERMNAKPKEPVEKPLRTKEEIQKEEVAKMEKSIKESEENMKKMDENTRKSVAPVIDQLKQMLKEYKDPDNQMFTFMVESEKMQQESDRKNYEEDLKEWEENYPADYRIKIKKRLQEFLNVTASVDFNAELKESYGKKRFVNPAYERKDNKWKMAFRAGKPVVDDARAFATQWIAELK